MFSSLSQGSMPQVSLLYKMVSAHFLENYLSQSFRIQCADCSCDDKTPIDFGIIVEGHNSHFCKNNVNTGSAYYLENCSSQSFYISHADWY